MSAPSSSSSVDAAAASSVAVANNEWQQLCLFVATMPVDNPVSLRCLMADPNDPALLTRTAKYCHANGFFCLRIIRNCRTGELRAVGDDILRVLEIRNSAFKWNNYVSDTHNQQQQQRQQQPPPQPKGRKEKRATPHQFSFFSHSTVISVVVVVVVVEPLFSESSSVLPISSQQNARCLSLADLSIFSDFASVGKSNDRTEEQQAMFLALPVALQQSLNTNRHKVQNLTPATEKGVAFLRLVQSEMSQQSGVSIDEFVNTINVEMITFDGTNLRNAAGTIIEGQPQLEAPKSEENAEE